MKTTVFVLLLLIGCASSAYGQTPAVPSTTAATASGEAIYQQRCSMCHDQVSERIPPKTALQQLPAAQIVRTLDSGVMVAIAFTMSHADREVVAAYLGTNEPVAGPPAGAFCANRTVKVSDHPKTAWNGWSPASDNARFEPADQAKLTIDQIRGLKLKWAFGFAGDGMTFAPPTVIDDQVFVGSAGGVVHAMRAESGCLQWVYQANGPVRSSIVVAPSGKRHALLFGDMTGWFYALSAETGKQLWKVHVNDHDSTRLSGGPAVYKGVVFVPVASWEETRSSDKDYNCCTFRGSVLALRIRDGAQLWKTWMTDPATERGKQARGTTIYGPSGAGVWSRPTLDLQRHLLYIATGDNYSPPATQTSDAIIALDMTTGKIVWIRQITKEDVFNGICVGQPGCGPDADFASSPILVRTSDGRELLLAGQKSGLVWALDPEKKGEIVWSARVGKGALNGGVQWGMTADGTHVFAQVSDLERSRAGVNRKAGGGLTALRIDDGKQEWHVTPEVCADDAPPGCSPAQPGAITSIPGAVFATSSDGHLRAYTSEDGQLLWDFNTMRDFDTVDGVKANGGSIDGPGPVVVNGMVFMTSGYPRNGGIAGNVLLMFAPE